MQAVAYPKCCTSTIITGMGESDNSAARSGDYMTSNQMLTKLVSYMDTERICGRAMLQCVITDQQQRALKVMRLLGWRFGPWAKSKNHPNTKTRLCYWLVTDGTPNLDEVRRKLGPDTPRNK